MSLSSGGGLGACGPSGPAQGLGSRGLWERPEGTETTKDRRPPPPPGMSAEASGPAAAEAQSLEVPKPAGLEPGSAAYGLKPLTPNSKYVKLNVGGSLHYTTLRTLTGQDTMLKAMFSGRAEVLTDAGGTRAALAYCPASSRSPSPFSPSLSSPSLLTPLLSCRPVNSFSLLPSPTSHGTSLFSFFIPFLPRSLHPAVVTSKFSTC